MFTAKQLMMVQETYFDIIRKTECFIELRSKNTKHHWIIMKERGPNKYPYMLYHKHTRKTPYYHKHWQIYTFQQSINSIKSHDDYILRNSK